MNILMLTTHANTGGITSYILTLGDALTKSGHKVWVVSSGGNCVERMEALGIKHVKLDIRTKSELHPKLWLNFGKLNALINTEKIDVIHAQTRVMQVLGTALSAVTDVHLVTTCHGFFRPRWFRRTFPCWGEAVIAISKPVAGHLMTDFKVPEVRIHLVPNGIDLDIFKLTNENKRQQARQLLGINASPLIGIIARLSDVKGINVLIKAMPTVLKAMPTSNLVIVGQGPEEDNLKQITQELGLNNKIHFKNMLNQPQDILPAFDLFVMPSIMEGLGLSVMEAQACGIPVVASKVGGLIDLIQYGVTGFLVEPNDPEALAERIIEALRNPEKLKNMTQRARHNIEEYFSAQRMARETIKVYEQHSRR